MINPLAPLKMRRHLVRYFTNLVSAAHFVERERGVKGFIICPSVRFSKSPLLSIPIPTISMPISMHILRPILLYISMPILRTVSVSISMYISLPVSMPIFIFLLSLDSPCTQRYTKCTITNSTLGIHRVRVIH